MSRPFSARRSDDGKLSFSRQSDVTALEPTERLQRLAALVAVGDMPLPADLEPAELSIVLAEVARLRRARLVSMVARAIARDIRETREP